MRLSRAMWRRAAAEPFTIRAGLARRARRVAVRVRRRGAAARVRRRRRACVVRPPRRPACANSALVASVCCAIPANPPGGTIKPPRTLMKSPAKSETGMPEGED